MTQDTSSASRDYQLASFLPYQLSIASNAVSDLIAQRYRSRFGLKVTEWRVIAVLGDAQGRAGEKKGGGRLTQRDLTEATLMDKVAVNRACKVLEERGLVTRVDNENDGRSHLLALTQDGEAIHHEVMPLAKATERDILEGLDAAEEAALRSMLAKLRARAGALAGSGKA